MNIVTVLEQQVLTLMFGLPVSSACLAVLSCIIDTESIAEVYIINMFQQLQG